MPRRGREPVETEDYTDSEGNVLTLRRSLSPRTIRKLNRPHRKDAASSEDVWARRNEMLFEYLAVSWEISGLPLDDQKMLIGALSDGRFRRAAVGARDDRPPSRALPPRADRVGDDGRVPAATLVPFSRP
jgi:hypothetical protein